MTTDQPLDLDAIEALANAATPGPWCTDSWEIYQGTEYEPGMSLWIGETCRGTGSLEQDRADAAFVAAARTAVPALLAEVRRLRAELAKEERLHGDTIDDRDHFHDMADKLAYAVAPEEVIGEHSSMNCPWENALDLITPMAEVDKLRAQLDATARLAGRLETKLRELGAPATVDVAESHVVADGSDDPEHVDDCPGCTRPCGHDDYHAPHEWADRPGVWCPGISYADDQPAAAGSAAANEEQR